MEPYPGPSTGLAHRLILSSEQAEELVVNSGRQGVFAFIQDNNVGPRPIRWFQRQSNDKAETYLQGG